MISKYLKNQVFTKHYHTQNQKNPKFINIVILVKTFICLPVDLMSVLILLKKNWKEKEIKKTILAHVILILLIIIVKL